jgi:hypothetical protein
MALRCSALLLFVPKQQTLNCVIRRLLFLHLAVLFQEFVKQPRIEQDQARKLPEHEAAIAQLKKQVKLLAAYLQKVTEQVALDKPESQFVAIG